MTRREFQQWMDCTTDFCEHDRTAVRRRKEDDADLCIATAIQLLEHLDPFAFAIQASATGISIYPRHHIHKCTTFEQHLLRTFLPIPADWTGGLAHIDQQHRTSCKTSSDTSGTLQSRYQAAAASERAQAVAFSLSRFTQKLQEFSSAGATSGIESTPDASQSIFKDRSGRRRWRRSAKPSSKTS